MATLADRLSDDIAKFTNPKDFGTEATLTTPTATVTLNVVFQKPFSASDMLGSSTYNTNPTALCNSVDVVGVTTDATLVIGSATYYVITPRPLGEFTLLVLSTDRQ